MWSVYSKYRKVVDCLLVVAFWLVICIIFFIVSVIRPYCVQHPYKELLCVVFIAIEVMITRMLLFPRLFQKGRRTLFWITTTILLCLFAGAELWLVYGEIVVINPHVKEISGYMPTIFFSVLLRNTGILLCRLLPLWIPRRDSSSLEKQESTGVLNEEKELSGNLDDSKKGMSGTVSETVSETIPETVHETVIETKPETKPVLSDQNLDLIQKAILEIIMKNPGCNTQQIVSKNPYGISQRSVERCINALKKKNLIEHIGSLKTGGYRIINNVKGKDFPEKTLPHDESSPAKP